jgi:hypothetical protein
VDRIIIIIIIMRTHTTTTGYRSISSWALPSTLLANHDLCTATIREPFTGARFHQQVAVSTSGYPRISGNRADSQVFQTNPNPAVAMKSVFLAGDHISAQIIQPIRIEHFGPESTFGDVKANTVSQLVALKGRVVRIDKSKCNIVGAMYWCPKCAHDTFASFEDGIYVAPSCPHGRY